jgi:hypothetical protein
VKRIAIGGKTVGKKTETRVGLGFAEALAILFIALKLTGVIAWSCWKIKSLAALDKGKVQEMPSP